MIYRFTNAEIDIDLSIYQFTQNEENYRLSTNFFTKYTWPITIVINDELNAQMGFILDYNSKKEKSYFEGWFYHDGVRESAVLEVEETEGQEARINIRFGFDDLPNWDKKLSELPLEVVDLEVNLAEHAAGIATQTWPEVNYNFPMLHTDLYDTTSDDWAYFLSKINNQIGGVFQQNIVDEEDGSIQNRNIIQPLPHLFHLLTVGFLDAGYTLSGDILAIDKLKKAWVYAQSDYYSNTREDSFEWSKIITDYDNTFQWNTGEGNHVGSVMVTTMANYSGSITFPANGKYKIAGNIHVRRFHGYFLCTFLKAAIPLNIIAYDLSTSVEYDVVSIDFNIDIYDFESEAVDLMAQAQPWMSSLPEYGEGYLADLTITPLEVFDEEGNPVPALLGAQTVDLTKCVPDITFGELVTTLRNYLNLSLEVSGSTIAMNIIKNAVANTEVISLSDYEVQYPVVKRNSGNSFEFKFKEIDSEDYLPVFANINGVQTSGYTVNDKTTTTEINAIPLPLKTKGNITTAYTVIDCKDRLGLVFYDATNFNYTEDPSSMFLPEVYSQFWQRWIEGRINADAFEWDFAAHFIQVRNLNILSIIYAYNKLHIIKTLQKTNLGDHYQLEITTETIETTIAP